MQTVLLTGVFTCPEMRHPAGAAECVGSEIRASDSA